MAGGSFDPGADLEPIVALIRDQACDLEGDVLPIVARELPELGGVRRPLKNWGAPWLVREILAARDQRLAGQPVEAPPPARRAPAIGGRWMPPRTRRCAARGRPAARAPPAAMLPHRRGE